MGGRNDGTYIRVVCIREHIMSEGTIRPGDEYRVYREMYNGDYRYKIEFPDTWLQISKPFVERTYINRDMLTDKQLFTLRMTGQLP